MKEKYELNRKMYKDIKKMDHNQMSGFCQTLYTKGYAAGQKESAGLSEEEVKAALLQVKGVGEKKMNDILAALKRAQEEKERLV